MKTLYAIGLGLILGGCAFTPHDVKIAPIAAPQASTIGEGTKIFFRFSDERDDATVGHRSVATVGAKISAPTLDAEIERNLRLGLTTKGYSIVPDQGIADATAIYRLRSFKFDIETGFWTGAQNAATVLAVDGVRAGKTYTNVYRSGSEQRILAVPGGDAIDQQLNAALDSTINQAWSDGNLDLFLTGKSGN